MYENTLHCPLLVYLLSPRSLFCNFRGVVFACPSEHEGDWETEHRLAVVKVTLQMTSDLNDWTLLSRVVMIGCYSSAVSLCLSPTVSLSRGDKAGDERMTAAGKANAFLCVCQDGNTISIWCATVSVLRFLYFHPAVWSCFIHSKCLRFNFVVMCNKVTPSFKFVGFFCDCINKNM